MRLPNVLWYFVVLIALPFLLAVIIPAFSKTKAIAARVLCESHLKGFSTAMRVYAGDYNGQYPTQEHWCDLILEYPGGFNENAFWCREEPRGTFSYAVNKNLYEIEPNNVLPQQVLLFEADLGRNGVGGSKEMVLRHEHNGRIGCNIAFADGHVEFVTEDEIDSLKWTVE